ncbi:MAG TPA: LuxR C-terminal-related transcriptional regulator [Candidatus Dormibacteraeota bacterium]|nr:LuxR C-terminal-related transcriptional regulator [Candidatus Dormibacteraeota bacterium]
MPRQALPAEESGKALNRYWIQQVGFVRPEVVVPSMITMGRPRRPRGNLPAESTTFIGRHRELAELKKTLANARLVSLIGPGGVGKTRLAIRCAAEIGRSFPDGAWLVELARLEDPALVPNALLSALDLRDQTAAEPLTLLLSYLRGTELLLVIDSCEHLIAASRSLATQILASAPGVKLLITSREPLSVSGEHVLPLPPFDLPEVNASEPAGRVLRNEAVELFVERASAASGRFELTEANATTVVELCRRLDGLPLAIELAAVRTRALSVNQILDRLADRFRLLTGGAKAALPRHQTLRTTIDWSYDHLDGAERVVLMRISVFTAAFTLEAAEAVCACDQVPSPDVLDVLSSLVEKSLVEKTEERSSARYRLHETMREYALLKLREAGEEEGARERFAHYYADLCRRCGEEALFQVVEWLERMDGEIDHVRALLQRCIESRDYRLGVELAGSLGWYWRCRATTEGVRWLDGFLGRGDAEPAALAQAYFMRGMLGVIQNDPLAAGAALSQALPLIRETGNSWLLVTAVSILSVAKNIAGEHARAAELAADASNLAEVWNEVRAAAPVAYAQGFNAFFDGDFSLAKAMFSRALDASRESGDLFTAESCLAEIALACFLGGEGALAKPLIQEAVSIARRLDDRQTLAYLLLGLGGLAAFSGDGKQSALLLGAGERLRVEVGIDAFVFSPSVFVQAREAAIAILGEEGFEAEFNAGRHLSRDAALSLAMGESPRAVAEAPADNRTDLLGKRESAVAKLVAEGLSNKEIGARMFISDRTVESHVRSIMNKLGFKSRAQIASWMASSSAGPSAMGSDAGRPLASKR